jgi:hypothetical protein
MPWTASATLLRDLGEHEPARQACEEALEIYWPLAQRLPRAFGQDFLIMLRNYLWVTGEAEDDPWWRM